MIPLNWRKSFAGIVLKLAPVMVTEVPEGPALGAIDVRTGDGTVNCFVSLPLAFVTVRSPVFASSGTLTSMRVETCDRILALPADP